MARAADFLEVYLAGVRCGVLEQDAHGLISFSYERGYQGIPLSMALPVSLQPYSGKVVHAFLMGLLPDEESTRNKVAASLDISPNNPFKLLEHMGLDCPGAVQVRPPGARQIAKEVNKSAPLTEHDIAQRLAAVRENEASAWVDAPDWSGHWSLGGCQAKFALRKSEGFWYDCQGDEPTTHIFKPGVHGLEGQALTECLSMKLATRIGLPAAPVEYHLFEDQPAIVVKRYDRMVAANGQVLRIHQEDLCQALGISPLHKYAEQGGPSTVDIIKLLRKTGKNARENVYGFILYLFFNYLIGATDAHAKNHSLMHLGAGEIRIAPLYDVASIAPYRSLGPTKRKPLRAALSIGGENRFGEVGPQHVEKMVSVCGLEELGLSADFLVERLAMMAEIIPVKLHDLLSDEATCGYPGFEAIAAALESRIGSNCGQVTARST